MIWPFQRQVPPRRTTSLINSPFLGGWVRIAGIRQGAAGQAGGCVGFTTRRSGS